MALDTWPSGNWDRGCSEWICVEHTVRWLSAYNRHYWDGQQSTERDTIIAESLDLLQDILPKINDRKPPGVKLSRIEKDTLASYEQGVLVPGHLENR
jgi:hypothetical protein